MQPRDMPSYEEISIFFMDTTRFVSVDKFIVLNFSSEDWCDAFAQVGYLLL